jgi:hypothetical protein
MACKMTEAVELKTQVQLNVGHLQTLNKGGCTKHKGGHCSVIQKTKVVVGRQRGHYKDCDDQVKDYGNQVKDLGKDQMEKKCELTGESIQSKAFTV